MLSEEDGDADEPELVELLLHYTNTYDRRYLAAHPNLPSRSRAHIWQPVTREGLKAFLGLLLAMGLAKKPTIASYWIDGSGTWLSHTLSLGAVMSRNRFQGILVSALQQ